MAELSFAEVVLAGGRGRVAGVEWEAAEVAVGLFEDVADGDMLAWLEGCGEAELPLWPVAATDTIKSTRETPNTHRKGKSSGKSQLAISITKDSASVASEPSITRACRHPIDPSF
ncbi:hypothetical protein [Kocuria sp. CPCC 205263]|uniref:hypothetical protein n=1 Tax=Kocuria sp. CPCC 205263 TaxID=3073555 RepID=UPI0034D728C7